MELKNRKCIQNEGQNLDNTDGIRDAKRPASTENAHYNIFAESMSIGGRRCLTENYASEYSNSNSANCPGRRFFTCCHKQVLGKD